MNSDPRMPRPRGSYAGPDESGNFPEVAEEPITPTRAEEQELSNPFAGMFDGATLRGSNGDKMGKYGDSFSRRISHLEGDVFLDAVRTNDIEEVEQALQTKDPSHSPDTNEEQLRAGLIIAIKNRYIEMVKMLLDHGAPVGNAFFHAVDGSSTPVVKTMCENLKGKKAILDCAVNAFSEDAEFPSTTTPLMMASCANEHDICELLIHVGAELPSLAGVLDRVEHAHDIYERALARLHWHKAMSSEAYLLFSSTDPIRAAFEAGQMIDETMKDQLTHIKPDYRDLRLGLDKFLTNYLDLTQNTAEISTLLSEIAGTESTSDTQSLPRRLIYALDLKFKSFTAHNNCQQYVLDRWYQYHTEWEELPMSHFVLRTTLIFILMPLLCVVYILFPLMGVKRFMKMPFVRFILQMASRAAFSLFLIYATVTTDGDEQIAGDGNEAEAVEAPPKSPEELRSARIEHYLEYRGCPAHFIIWLIYIWILGMTWREVKELWRQGFKEYFSEAFNWVDVLQLVLYWISIILTFTSYYTALHWVKLHSWDEWNSCVIEDEGLGSQGSQVERPPESAQTVHARFECESRTDWHAYDPLLVAEGCFALATVLTFLGALRDTVILSFVGPLRISLGGMIVDIVRFFVLFFFLWVSFAIGLTQLYETFMVLKTLECEEGEDCHPAFLTFQSTLGTLFWSLFDLADTEELEIHPTAGMVFTESVGLFLYAAYLIIAVVVMLNALIAMMSNTYTRVEENTEVTWKVERTKLMVDYMVNSPTLPAPFNLVPTPKTIYKIFMRCYFCCCFRKSMERKKMDAERDRSLRETQYKMFIQSITDRYINNLRTGLIDDDSERLQMDLSTLKETLRMMRNHMRDMHSENRKMHKNVEDCVKGMDDMTKRQHKLEEQQKKQLDLLRRGSRPPSPEPTPPPSVSPPVPPQEDEIRPDRAGQEESARPDLDALSQALRDLPWIDSEV